MGPNFDRVAGRIRALDELRGLAILAVVASHIGLVFGPDLAAARVLSVPAFGVGVDFFFVISGFAATESARRSHLEADGAFWRDATAFWSRRILRISLPAWAVIVLIALFQAYGISLGETADDLKAAAGFYANLYWAPCFDGAAGCGAPTATSHFWSLASEMQFYVSVPFLIALSPKLTAVVCMTTLVAGAVNERPWGGFWWTFRLDGFAVGVLLSLGLARRWPLPRFSKAVAAFWLVAASILARVFGALASGSSITMVAIIFGLVVASAIEQRPEPQGGSVLQRLGELSFSIYLVHLPVMSGIHQALGDLAPPILVLSIAAGLTVVLALLLEAILTRPAQILGKHFSEWVCGRAERMLARVAL
ncbi:acyltransferase [Methylocystis sp. IM3]|uniref:acyltransferase family protein n=1 Tax=unclassified Methylocystis TaxID=2625913 RepID=UPI0030F4D66E